ncbi:MAG: hypothetical protein M3508_03890 [Actinomycetota bacterium]|nr:hypothetical protein [Actinomycetota bacterium]
MGDGEQLLVVTTRSRLRGAWFFPAMLIASRRVRRQLTADHDVVRWASVVAGPTEFWTITVWRSRHHMQEFMRSGAHNDIMWLFSRWLRSFWLMRWRPGSTEVGDWDGLTLAPAPAPTSPAPLVVDDERRRTLDRALEHLPWLQAATGADGAACYDSAPAARHHRAQVASASALIVRLHTPAWQVASGLRSLRRVRDEAAGSDVRRMAVGIGRLGDCYLLALWVDSAGREAMRRSPSLLAVQERWPSGCWINDWEPENEFGHWDGMRVRRSTQRDVAPIAVPVIGGRRRSRRRARRTWLTPGRAAPPKR